MKRRYVQITIKMNSGKYFLLIILIFATQCVQKNERDSSTAADSLKNQTVHAPDAKPLSKIEFEQQTVFADELGMHNTGTFAVDSTGRIYFGDGGIKGRQEIYVYDAAGNFVSTIGRRGRGPGEFQLLSAIKIRFNKLYAYDSILNRISIFSVDSRELLETVNLNPDGWNRIGELKTSQLSTFFYPRSDNTILMGFKGSPRMESSDADPIESVADIPFRYYLMDMNGDVVSEKIFENEGMQFENPPPPAPGLNMRFPFPFERSSLLAIADDGSFYSANTGEFLIKKYDATGTYVSSIYIPVEQQPFDSEVIRDSRLDDLSSTDLPDDWPALHRMIIDDQNRLWVSTITKSDSTFQWWVLNEEGELVSKFIWPGKRANRNRGSERRIRKVRDGYLYAYEPDEENPFLGNIAKYEIRLNPNE